RVAGARHRSAARDRALRAVPDGLLGDRYGGGRSRLPRASSSRCRNRRDPARASSWLHGPLEQARSAARGHTRALTARVLRAIALARREAGVAEAGRHYSFAVRSSCALIATITVLADIRIAPTAGASSMPAHASTPAASGMARML